MGRLPKVIGEQDQLRARARGLEGQGMPAATHTRLVKATVHKARADRLSAKAKKLSGGADREAEANERLDAALAELNEAEDYQRALPEALRSLWADSNRLASEHRESVFLPHARQGVDDLKRRAVALLPAVEELLTLAEEAALRIDRLRHLDPDNGSLTGPRAQPAADLGAVRAALAAVAGQGMVWPWSLDPETGANISHRERRERDEADALRRRGWTPPTGREAA